MNTLKRVIQIISGTLVGLLLLEWGIRSVSPHAGSSFLFQAPENAPNGMYVTDSNLLYVPNPNFSAQSISPGYSVPIRINSLSLRGPELSPKTSERWLVMGDSFAFSAQATEEEHFIGVLNGLQDIEFINGGADGYGTWQALLRYKSLRKQAEIDGLLVLFFVGNDFFDNQQFEGLQRKSASTQSGTPLLSKAKPAWERFLSQHSYLYAHWKIYQRAKTFQNDPQAHGKWKSELMLFASPQYPKEMIEATDQVFRKLAGIVPPEKLMVAIAAPYFVVEQDRMASTFEMVQISPADVRLDTPTQQLTSILQKYQIPYCDLAPALRAEYAKGIPQYLSFDGHWTPAGHKTVANRIQACMNTAFGSSNTTYEFEF